ncbi:MAG: hypothetical protein Q8878_04405 [Bacillota bacterium]|nr:hypothetical protein [Bacillota bacterium]
MQRAKLFDETIKETLTERSEQVEASEMLGLKVRNAIKTKKESFTMKKRFTIKSAAILAAVICLGTITVFASGHLASLVTHSSSQPSFTAFPTEKELQNRLGFVPAAVETFSNGYAFDKATVGETSAIDEDGNKTGNYKTIDYDYALKGKKVSLAVNKVIPGEVTDKNAKAVDCGGVTLSYLSQKYKLVPPDYKMTDEDKKAEQSGELVFSYGSSEVENKVIQSASWTDGGLSYILMAFDSDLTQDDFSGMAKEIINAGK